MTELCGSEVDFREATSEVQLERNRRRRQSVSNDVKHAPVMCSLPGSRLSQSSGSNPSNAAPRDPRRGRAAPHPPCPLPLPTRDTASFPALSPLLRTRTRSVNARAPALPRRLSEWLSRAEGSLGHTCAFPASSLTPDPQPASR
ncbi:hypothetical protein SKAU_G00217040 [Synaphobranchus kaupii]|uniref:Uncharacterized protein n=1 Tax=Synaphobranchus kaupii TaxID=118154 RepID=A0A9Q1IUM7_SYNKA|nr:hypothetical protein SKAU_G00217040 [Synaphobranchus kaupii]